MVLATICYLALPSLGLHAFVPLVPPRPVVRGPVAPPVAVVDQATQRPAASGAYLPPFRPILPSPQGSRVSQDLAMRLPVPMAAPAVLSPAFYVYRYMMIGGMCMIAAFLIRRILAQRASAARLRTWASTLKERVKSLVYTTFAVAATAVMLTTGPAMALSTTEAPMPAAVHRVLPATKKLPRTLKTLIRRPQAPTQKMLKYSAKNYIFSDSLTSMSRLEREFDDIVWYGLANRRLHRARTLANLGEGALLVAGVRGGLLAYERWQKEQERKDIEEELEMTGMYVSVDASSVVEFTDAATGKKKKADSKSDRLPIIPGSVVIHYELPSSNAKLEKAVQNTVEAPEFSTTLLEELQYKFQALGDVERAHMEGFMSVVFPKIPTVQPPKMEVGVIAGRVFLTDLGSDATEAVVQGFGNAGTRSMIQDAFRGPLAAALGLEDEQVMITNILRNRDPLYGDGGKIGDGKVRQFLSRRAPGVLRWVESQTSAQDDDFWETAVTQTIYRDTGPTNKDDSKEGDAPNTDSPGDSPGGSADA